MKKVLLVDDEVIFVKPLAKTIEKAGYEVDVACSAEEAMEKLRGDEFDLVLTDVRMPGASGIDFTSWVKAEYPDLPVIVMTAYGSIKTAVSAMKAGAEDYILKPFDPEEILLLIGRAIEFSDLKAEKRARAERSQDQFLRGSLLVAESPAMKRILAMVEELKDLDTTVLITGETGTGKQLLAKTIHYRGVRRDRPFVEVNCAAIPETLFESELFGFTRGAFTGATKDKKGLIQLAHGGTLFLDEVGEVPLPSQAKLLRAIQEKKFIRIGGTREIEVDVRIIAATNKNLEEEVEKGRFRRDLYYRLNVYPIHIPPLRERREDIEPLARLFLENYSRKMGKEIREISRDSIKVMHLYDWPGNVRELQNVIERAVISCRGPILDNVGDFVSPSRREDTIDVSLDSPFREAKEKVVAEFERKYLEHVLRKAGGKLTEAARLAGMDNKNFSEKLKKYNLSIRDFR
ncbi:MAG: sigma-54-dependent Fis family transcriptional regulator [Deltaproteobacteria bacterium]|nr:MAG: sigma-54-dependent Fis family transcriptional regulator [Deltaproteobacteria bacterium]